MKLSREAHEKARRFVYAQGRPLERAFYAYHFEGGTAATTLAELAAFQNADGGFGHGLEPDLRLAGSSVIATTVALQHLRTLQVGDSDPLVQGALRYLMTTYDPALQAWPIIPSNVDDAPHAPWWAYDENLAQRWDSFRSNPRAEIVGYLYDYPNLVPAELRTELTQAIAEHLLAVDTLEMHDLLCYVRLVETPSLPADVRDQLLPRLLSIVDASVSRDPVEWAQYGLQPLTVASSPQSPFAGLLADAIQRNLDYAIQQQGDDGAWAPSWSWFGLYDEAWPQAERDWKGVLTVKTLRYLQSFGRLA